MILSEAKYLLRLTPLMGAENGLSQRYSGSRVVQGKQATCDRGLPADRPVALESPVSILHNGYLTGELRSRQAE